MVYIYILQLEDNSPLHGYKYYIGKTTQPEIRLESHFNSNGSYWTKKYKPIKVLEIIPNCDEYDEDKYTLKYMEKYGINNVRGGSFCEIKLNKENIITIKKMINTSTDKCYICGSNEHFVKDCVKKTEDKPIIKDIGNEKCDCISSYIKTHRRKMCLLNNTLNFISEIFDNENDIIEELKPDIIIDSEIKLVFCCNFCNKQFDTQKGATYHENIYCKLKNKESKVKEEHIESVCDAKTLIKKDSDIKIFCCSYCNKEFDTQKGAQCHENIYCKLKKKPINKEPNNKCYRCGREGHYSNNCYASKHVNGKYLN